MPFAQFAFIEDGKTTVREAVWSSSVEHGSYALHRCRPESHVGVD
jgi:hypothetical protein